MANYFSLKKSFTLLEILVVIGIIAILIGMGSVSYSSTQKKARDSKRKLDIGAIKNAMEQYYALCKGIYPTSLSGKTPDPIQSLINPDGCSSDTMIMSSTPKDPKADVYYDYDDGGGVSTPSICASDGATTPNLMETESTVYCVFLEQ